MRTESDSGTADFEHELREALRTAAVPDSLTLDLAEVLAAVDRQSSIDQQDGPDRPRRPADHTSTTHTRPAGRRWWWQLRGRDVLASGAAVVLILGIVGGVLGYRSHQGDRPASAGGQAAACAAPNVRDADGRALLFGVTDGRAELFGDTGGCEQGAVDTVGSAAFVGPSGDSATAGRVGSLTYFVVDLVARPKTAAAYVTTATGQRVPLTALEIQVPGGGTALWPDQRKLTDLRTRPTTVHLTDSRGVRHAVPIDWSASAHGSTS